MVIDRDLQIWTLLIALEAQNILFHGHLHRVYHSRMLVKSFLTFRFEVCLERFAVGLLETKRRGDVEVMKKVGDVKEN